MSKDFSNNYWTALGAIVALCALLYVIFTSQTTELIKGVSFTLALFGALYIYIQYVVIRRIEELERKPKQRR